LDVLQKGRPKFPIELVDDRIGSDRTGGEAYDACRILATPFLENAPMRIRRVQRSVPRGIHRKETESRVMTDEPILG
jgi:hypothetical protein